MSDETIEKSFQVSGDTRLVISNIRGSVTIQPGEANVIEVSADKHGGFDNGNFSVEMSQDPDGTVRVETRNKEAWFGFISLPPKVDYNVRVPQGTKINASGVSNSLNVSNLQGEFKFKTVSGDIELSNLTGPFKFKAVSGAISGSKLSGALELSTVSGKAKIVESNFPTADANTVSGDLILQSPIAAGPYQFSSVSGAVRMLVPAQTHCKAELNSVSGNIRSSLPVSSSTLGHGLKTAQLGEGGTLVRLKSVSGSLIFEVEGVPVANVSSRSAEENTAHAAPPSPPSVPPPAPLSTEEILQRIERGEMTVDEAIKLMKDQP